MKREFLFDRQGKTVVLYAGLLDLAHEKGVRSIRTQMLQAPSEQNGGVSIFKAVVELEDGRCFEGTGDASPTNVGRNIIPHALRMAETRAKARALRDALNINAVSLEELGDDDDAPRHEPRPTPIRNGKPETEGAIRAQTPLQTEATPSAARRQAMAVYQAATHAGLTPPEPPAMFDDTQLRTYAADWQKAMRERGNGGSRG